MGRDDTTASIEIPVYHPQATIEIPSMEFEIDSEMGDDTQFERLYTNRITGEKVFRSGNWTLEIPKKFKRLRIVATAGGSGGSVQKNLISGDLITNKSTKGTVEPLNVGETTEVWSSDFKITVPGGGISDPEASTVLVFGGIDTSLPYKTSNSPEQFSYLNIDNSKVFKFENKFENNNYPVNMVYQYRVNYIMIYLQMVRAVIHYILLVVYHFPKCQSQKIRRNWLQQEVIRKHCNNGLIL